VHMSVAKHSLASRRATRRNEVCHERTIRPRQCAR
jgi:hypothetical protein